MLEKYFQLKEHGTNVRTEVLAGITTFFTMAYILFVNPTMLAEGAGLAAGMNGADPAVQNGVFFATCISAFVGTALMAFLAKLPFAQAPGMGLNAFFAYTVMLGMGYSYSQSLAIVFISGILFITITVIGLREAIVRAIPANVKIAISAGIGLFLAFLGLQNAGISVNSDSTLVTLVNFSQISNPENHTAVVGAVLAVVGLLIIAALYHLKVKGSILIGIVAITLLGIPLGVTVIPESFNIQFGAQFNDFMTVSVGAFAGGFKDLFGETTSIVEGVFTVAMLVISFSLVDMFDTIGTLLGTAKKANLLDENGNMPGMKKALLCDAIATTTGAMLGTSTVTTYVESSAGIGEGGRTGLTSAVTAILFLAALVIAPFVGIVPSCATAPALIFVGALMISGVKDIDFSDISEAVPAFLTIAFMPLTYSIANGIAFGLISYVVIKAICGKFKEIHPITVVLAVLFIIRFFSMTV